MNHEMARELLWRGYPTDLRGSYFRQFWDVTSIPGALDVKGRVIETFKDIHPIHGWRSGLGTPEGSRLTALGGNRPLGRRAQKNLVLVIRGDLLRRYPNTEVYAIKAERRSTAAGGPRPGFDNMLRQPMAESAATLRRPILEAKFDPDVHCFGFDLTKGEAEGPALSQIGIAENQGWYFVLAERFGEPRFGLDNPTPQSPFGTATGANDLSWASVAHDANDLAALNGIVIKRNLPPVGTTLATADGAIPWGTDSASLAATLLQMPFRMYFHARDMIGSQAP
jgi:hypothetical protein